MHHGADTFVDVVEALEHTGISLKLLPTYSPELSAIELIFGTVKQYIRHQRTEESLLCALMNGFARITHQMVLKSCHHVITEFNKHPLNLPPVLERPE